MVIRQGQSKGGKWQLQLIKNDETSFIVRLFKNGLSVASAHRNTLETAEIEYERQVSDSLRYDGIRLNYAETEV